MANQDNQGAYQEFPTQAAEPRPGEHPETSNRANILGIQVRVQAILGTSATMTVAELFKLARGDIIPLNKRVGDPLDITVNGLVLARGEVVKVDDDFGGDNFGISITEIIRGAPNNQT